MTTSSTVPGQELAGKVALVTGAGQNIGRAIALDLASAGAAVAVNTRASREAAESVVQEIRAAGGGSIVALTGSGVLTGAVGKVHSSAAKSGLTGMIRALARELGQQGIRANCVSPGMINTTRPDHRSPRRDPKGLIPLERWGESEEIAAAVRFLCGPGASYVTGQTIHVNGGQTMF